VSSWQQAAQDKGVTVKQVRVNEEDCTLDMAHFKELLTDKTRLVAVTYASNTTGSIVDVKSVIELAKQVDALVYIDAVHYALHRLIDV
jgi:selenocysteine lyase/cysteine desulfurase